MLRSLSHIASKYNPYNLRSEYSMSTFNPNAAIAKDGSVRCLLGILPTLSPDFGFKLKAN